MGENDYDICVKRHESDPWCITYEHVANLRVAEGSVVKVGDVVGEAGSINEFTESGKKFLKPLLKKAEEYMKKWK